jgi:hypothetical protein
MAWMVLNRANSVFDARAAVGPAIPFRLFSQHFGRAWERVTQTQRPRAKQSSVSVGSQQCRDVEITSRNEKELNS